MVGENPGTNDPGSSDTVSIVRYPNRRLYDRSQARYVTLQEIAAMVREGKTVHVRDSKSNEDLTGTILTQIILEHYPERMNFLPVPVLHLLIRPNDIVLGLLRDYFRQSLLYLELWQQAARFNPVTTSMEWLQSLVPSAPGAPSSGGPRDADALSQRLADVERRIGALEPSTNNAGAPTSERPSEDAKPTRARPPKERRES